MGEFIDLKDKIKKYYSFTGGEIVGLVSSIVLIAFMISFKEWGTETFDASAGLVNFFNAIVIVALSMLVHDAGQRIWGLAIGFRIEYKVWIVGIIFGLMVTFVSKGNLWVILPGYIVVHHMAGHRLGFFRYGINIVGQGMIAFAGPLANLALVIFLKFVNIFVSNALIEKAIFFNVIYIITSMLPIPYLDGSRLYFASRMIYAFMMPFIVASSILLIIDINTLLALILSFLIGISLWITYYIVFERKIWSGPR